MRAENDNVTFLLPDYICKEVPDILKFAAVKIQYYPLTPSLEPDYKNIRGTFSRSGITLLLLVHFFGKISDTRRAATFCKKKKITLLEDCSHVTFDYEPSIGTRFSLFSPYKTEAIPHGGILRCAEENDFEAILRITKEISGNWPEATYTRWLIKKIVLKFLPTMSIRSLNQKNSENHPAPDKSVFSAEDFRRPAMFSLNMFLHSSVREHTRIRRETFSTIRGIILRWLERYFPQGFSILENQSYPYGLVLRFEETQTARRVLEEIRRKGVPVFSWPDLPNDLPAKSFARETKSKLLLIPVHHSISKRQMNGLTRIFK